MHNKPQQKVTLMNTPNTENIIMNQLFSLAQASEQYKKVEDLSYAGTKFFSDGTDIYATIDKPQQASVSTI